jgi:6-phosphogluconolactonase (cycloisomerase 2 family)
LHWHFALFNYKVQFVDLPDQSQERTRRRFLRATASVAGLGLAGFAASSLAKGVRAMSESSAYFAYVGSRTTRERNARGEGINVYRGAGQSGQWSHLQLISGLANPSYLAFDRSRRFLYAVHGDLTDISAFAIDPRTGTLSHLNSVSTFGKNPVHLTIDPTNRWVIVANHLSSTLAVLARNPDGSLGGLADEAKLTGKIGPHRIEQPFSKPHQVVYDRSERFLIVPDKGVDQVFTFTLDAANGKLTRVDAGTPRARDGSGPRHVVFHSTNAFAYVVNELDSTVTAHHFDPMTGKLTPFQLVTTLPDTFVGDSRASEITLSNDGSLLYASNRGHDSVATFAVDRATGRLAARSWTDAQGKTPRFFALDPAGRFLFVADEDSDRIVPFRADAPDGKLLPAGDPVNTGSPVCIVFAPG